MFTGIIEEVGEVFQKGKSKALGIYCSHILDDLKPGDSVAVNGVCLTAREINAQGFWADVMPDTLKSTNLGMLSPGSKVNLERALKADGRFGGHMVQGHVDGVGTIRDISRSGDFFSLSIITSSNILRYIVLKGSIALDGISLTIQKVDETGFCVGIIPTTLKYTALAYKRPGDTVNIETDILGKYMEKLMQKSSTGLTMEELYSMGF